MIGCSADDELVLAGLLVLVEAEPLPAWLELDPFEPVLGLLVLAVEELLAGLLALVFEFVEPFAGLFTLVADESADGLLSLLFELVAGLFPLILEPVVGLFVFTGVEPFVGLLPLVFELVVGLLVFAV